MKSPTLFVSTALASLVVLCTACASSGDSDSTGGASGLGGTSAGGTAAGGVTATGGASTTGGVTATGGVGAATGGVSSGGSAAGGVTATGGVNPTTGGTTGSGGATTMGGTTGSGGTTGTTGGSTGTTGGSTGTGGSTDTTGGSAGAGGGIPPTDVTVQLDQTKQTMEGFGINNNWAPAMSDSEADLMFDTTKGIGLSILRIGMASSGEPFNGSSCWQDIAKAKARGVKTFIGSLWSPPATWKAGQNGGANSENGGGHLKAEYLEQWTDRIAAFPAKVKQGASVDLYAMSPQNEPDFASCGMSEPCNGDYPTTLFTAEEMVALIKAVGPKLHALNPPVKVMAPEASEWLHTWSNESACCSEPGGKNSSDPLKCGFPATNCAPGKGYDYGHALYADKEAWAQFDIMGVHQYDTQVTEPWPNDVPEMKPVWQTEMSGVKWWPEQGPSTDIDNGVAVAGWIHEAVVNGMASAWLWWWWKAAGSTNEGLLLSNGTDTKRHYTLGNFSKFIRPGYTRVNIAGDIPADVLLSAYKGEDGTVVVVAINKGSASADVPITIAGGTAPASLTPWVTSASDNLAVKTAVTVTGSIFTASLGSMTVTTFVGN